MEIEVETAGRTGTPEEGTRLFPRHAAFRLTGSLDLPSLRAAWRAAVLRHGAGDVRPVCFIDLSSVPVTDPGALAAQLCDRWAAEKAARAPHPQARLSVARLTATEYVLLVAVDQMPDEQSFRRLLGSVSQSCAADGVLRQLRTEPAAAAAEPLPAPGYDGLPVHVLAARHAVTAGPAVVWAGETTDYAELDALGSRLAGALVAAGVAPGDAVAVRMAPGARRVAALLGVLASGARLLWLAPGPAGERGRAMLDVLRPVCMVTDGATDGDDLVSWYRTELGGRVLDAGGPADPAGIGQTPAIGPRDGAYVAFTSGSTGTPKGIPQSHDALAQFAHWMGRQFGMGPGARVAQWVSPEHDPALAEVCATLVAGGTLFPVSDAVRTNPDALVPWLAEHRITHIQTVPSFARDLLEVITDTAAGQRLGALSHVLLMGEALRAELVGGLTTALPSVRVFNLYGPTETVAATWHEVTDVTAGPVPIGRAIPGRQVLVLDGDDLTCPVGVTGGVVVRSRYVTPGYLGSTDRSAFRPVERLDTPDGDAGWYRTGDLARRLADGTLEFRGRADFQIKLSGNRVELTEIEASLASHDSVLECAVVPRTDRPGPIRQLAVHVVPKRGTDGLPLGAAPQWRAHLRRHFGALNIPATFHEVSGRLPRNAAGKVDRARLR
ncbi:AMP-binding protein [Streptomyces antarcticus]|uniref:AMP-binding protein n=1 Tax=Streptomyces antarcticus TaxID=2996458 RepID=UPI00226F3BAE|nr:MULTISPECIES: AMP-binding protein [unclassified Streptomyces]MCY0942943.1 AMP-binding protein [Streptomyces sp. H34-AA3]MCZ4083097.1 AMP-binding protein [Streptomyces sp. H34-S5]